MSSKTDYAEARLTLGRHACQLVVFDAAHVNGLVWGDFVIIVKGQACR